MSTPEQDAAAQAAELVAMPCPCGEEHDPITARSLGMVCAHCGEHTGNGTQGHYWAYCKVYAAKGLPFNECIREHHFCCPGDCALEKPDVRKSPGERGPEGDAR